MIYSFLGAIVSAFFLFAAYRKYGKDPVMLDVSLGSTILLLATVNAFIFSVYQVPSESMYPQLKVGDFVIVQKFNLPEEAKSLVGKTVVYKDPRAGKTYVKRIVGAKGDIITWNGQELMVNGERKYIHTEACNDKSEKPKEALFAFMSENNVKGSWKVVDGLFMVGTNICRSVDSRSYGEVPQSDLIGVAIGVCNGQGCKTINERYSE